MRRPCVPAARARDLLDDSSGTSAPSSAAPRRTIVRELLDRERLELVHLRARQQRGVDLEVRVLGRRADQRDHALLDAGQQGVLLRLVEAVDLVEEEDRPLSVRAEPLARAREYLSDLRDGRRHGGQLLERRACDAATIRASVVLPAPRWPVEDRRAHAILLDRGAQRRPLAEHLLLPDELLQRLRAHSQGQGRHLRQALLRGV